MVDDVLRMLLVSPVPAVAGTGLIAAILETPGAGHRARPRTGAVLAVAASALFVLCGALAASGALVMAVLSLSGGVAAVALAVWLLRPPSPRDPGGDDGGAGGPEPPRPPDPTPDGIDWAAFERDVAAYARGRVPAA